METVLRPLSRPPYAGPNQFRFKGCISAVGFSTAPLATKWTVARRRARFKAEKRPAAGLGGHAVGGIFLRYGGRGMFMCAARSATDQRSRRSWK